MDYDLKLYGPIVIPTDPETDSKTISDQNKRDFLAELDKQGIGAKDGVYIFALRNSKGCTPWYVGKATAQNIGKESMADHKRIKYQLVLARGYKGTPVMFFVCQPGTVNNLSEKICDDVETELIQFAKYKNDELMNKQKTKLVEWGIQGVIRTSKKSSGVERMFARSMGMV